LTKQQFEAKYLAKQRVTRKVAAKCLLEEELAKAKPSWASVATFRAAAGDGEGPGSKEIVDVRLVARKGQPAKSDMAAAVNNPTTVAQVSGMAALSQPITIPEIQAEATPVITDDAPMSIGDSEEEGSESGGSDGFSQSGSSISRGGSTVSRGSRKRPADESPEREPGETSRREFPGLITRSEGGCRVYVPPTERRYATDATGTTCTIDSCNLGGCNVNESNNHWDAFSFD